MHCGSSNHWDRECRRPPKNERNARTFLAEADETFDQAMNDYNEAFIEAMYGSEEEAAANNVEADDNNQSEESSLEEEAQTCSEGFSSSEEDF